MHAKMAGSPGTRSRKFSVGLFDVAIVYAGVPPKLGKVVVELSLNRQGRKMVDQKFRHHFEFSHSVENVRAGYEWAFRFIRSVASRGIHPFAAIYTSIEVHEDHRMYLDARFGFDVVNASAFDRPDFDYMLVDEDKTGFAHYHAQIFDLA